MAILGPLRRPLRIAQRYLPPLNFITIHYAYFIGTCLLCTMILWGSSTPSRSVGFIDALFLVVSAMTLAGLNTVNLSTLNTFQQVVLFLLLILGSAIFVSAFVVHVRLRAFERKISSIREIRERERGRSSGSRRFSLSRSRNRNSTAHSSTEQVSPLADEGVLTDRSTEKPNPRDPAIAASEELRTITRDSQHTVNAESQSQAQGRITFHPGTIFRLPSPEIGTRQQFIAMQGVGARPTSSISSISEQPASADVAMNLELGLQKGRFWENGAMGRNSQFHHLTNVEREELGGVEYKAVRFLAWLVPVYFVLWQIVGCISLGAYITKNRPETTLQNGLNPFWVGAFNAVSAFNNSGMSLLDANMIAFQDSVYILLTMSLLILAGNTCYPIFLRLIVWSIRKLMPANEEWQDHRNTLQFLLDHPRRCYTNLFPSEHTWWLLSAVVCLNGIDWIAFEVLNIGNDKISHLPVGIRVIDGLFQATAVRSGGFYVVPIPSVRIALQVLYVLMMYVSVYPVVITIRNSNVYEERSLGIYADDMCYDSSSDTINSNSRPTVHDRLFNILTRGFGGGSTTEQHGGTKSYFVRQQLRAQLAHDLWWVCLAVFFIMIIEAAQFERDPATFSVFNVIFEVISGYGCVGISVGLPDQAYSFCGSWHKLSKLILCAVMLRGRHRGLPVAIDKAILLPGECVARAEEEDAQMRVERSVTRGSVARGSLV